MALLRLCEHQELQRVQQVDRQVGRELGPRADLHELLEGLEDARGLLEVGARLAHALLRVSVLGSRHVRRGRRHVEERARSVVAEVGASADDVLVEGVGPAEADGDALAPEELRRLHRQLVVAEHLVAALRARLVGEVRRSHALAPASEVVDEGVVALRQLLERLLEWQLVGRLLHAEGEHGRRWLAVQALLTA